MANILDGKATAAAIRQELKSRIDAFAKAHGRPPGLAVLLVGDDPASHIYVRNKEKAANDLGMKSIVRRLPANISQDQLLKEIQALNSDNTIDGLMVQMPLPKNLSSSTAVLAIDPDKDADGLHPTNLGKLITGDQAPKPCTPAGVMDLLRRYDIKAEGKTAVVIGRSAIVGKPMSLLLLEANATVTVCHSKSRDLPAIVKQADIVVAAVGQPELVRGSWLKPGAVVVDVGMNRLANRLVGDVHFEEAKAVASHITPVPGGVGPLTIAFLLQNTVQLAETRIKAKA